VPALSTGADVLTVRCPSCHRSSGSEVPFPPHDTIAGSSRSAVMTAVPMRGAVCGRWNGL